MIKLALFFVATPLFLLIACSAPREPEQLIASPRPGLSCERSVAAPDGFGGALAHSDREGAPDFAGSRLTFRDPYFSPGDPVREEAISRCLKTGEEPG